jgi:hypothetical protein
MKKCKITVKMNPPQRIIRRLGLGAEGDIQSQFTNIVNRRITRYMPAGPQAVLSTKLKRIKSPKEIEVAGPYAHYQYKGEIWGPNIPVRSNGNIVRYYSPPRKYPTGRPMKHSRAYNDRAGPDWDKRLMAEEGDAIAADLQRYIDEKAGK